MENQRVKNVEKRKRDFKIAEIVYYSIGGVVLLIGFVFSVFGVILMNYPKQNFENTWLNKAQTDLFSWLNWDTTFGSAGLIFMLIAIVYFTIIFVIFTRKADEVEKIAINKKSRQRQVTFVNKVEETVVETEVKESAE